MEKTKLDEKEVSPEVREYLKAKGATPPAEPEQPEQPTKPENQITAEDIQNFINNQKTK